LIVHKKKREVKVKSWENTEKVKTTLAGRAVRVGGVARITRQKTKTRSKQFDGGEGAT